MATSLLASLQTANLLPSPLIPKDFTPTIHLSIAFPTKPISNGTLVRVHEVQSAPTVSLSSIPSPNDTQNQQDQKQQQRFTLMLLDPDAPTPDDPKFAYWRHWVVANLSLAGGGRTLTEYLAPGPKDESGPHRYLFLVFLEPGEGLELEREDVGGEQFVERRSFGVEGFVERWGLRLVGVQWMRGVGDGWVGEE